MQQAAALNIPVDEAQHGSHPVQVEIRINGDHPIVLSFDAADAINIDPEKLREAISNVLRPSASIIQAAAATLDAEVLPAYFLGKEPIVLQNKYNYELQERDKRARDALVSFTIEQMKDVALSAMRHTGWYMRETGVASSLSDHNPIQIKYLLGRNTAGENFTLSETGSRLLETALTNKKWPEGFAENVVEPFVLGILKNHGFFDIKIAGMDVAQAINTKDFLRIEAGLVTVKPKGSIAEKLTNLLTQQATDFHVAATQIFIPALIDRSLTPEEAKAVQLGYRNATVVEACLERLPSSPERIEAAVAMAQESGKLDALLSGVKRGIFTPGDAIHVIAQVLPDALGAESIFSDVSPETASNALRARLLNISLPELAKK